MRTLSIRLPAQEEVSKSVDKSVDKAVHWGGEGGSVIDKLAATVVGGAVKAAIASVDAATVRPTASSSSSIAPHGAEVKGATAVSSPPKPVSEPTIKTSSIAAHDKKTTEGSVLCVPC